MVRIGINNIDVYSHLERSKLKLKLEFKKEDFWIGFYWKRSKLKAMRGLYEMDLWICLVPMLPIHLTWYKVPRWDNGYRY